MSKFSVIAKTGDIPAGEGRAFPFNDQMVAVFNDHGTFRAIDDMCPHMGASLASGHFEDNVVTCPWHSWSFDTRDGAWCENRRLTIDAYEVKIEGDEILIAKLESDSSGKSQPADESPSQEATAATKTDNETSAPESPDTPHE